MYYMTKLRVIQKFGRRKLFIIFIRFQRTWGSLGGPWGFWGVHGGPWGFPGRPWGFLGDPWGVLRGPWVLLGCLFCLTCA